MVRGVAIPCDTDQGAEMPAKSTPKPTRPETVRKGHKWCPQCGDVKVHDLFARNRRHSAGNPARLIHHLLGYRGPSLPKGENSTQGGGR